MQKNILIVDNNNQTRLVLQRFLADDYYILEAHDSKEALDILNKDPQSIAAVLLNMSLSAMDGYQLLEAIHADNVLSQIPVIVITDASDFDTGKRALALGASDYVTRPFDADRICLRLKNAISAGETRNQLQAIVDSIDNGVTAFVLHGKGQRPDAILVTDRFYELLGYSEEQYWTELDTPLNVVHKDDVGWVRKRLQETNRSGQPTTMEFRALRRDGREIWLRATIIIMHFAGMGGPVQLSVFSDITDSIHADQQRKNTDAQLKLLTDSIPGGIATYVGTVEKSRIIYFNDGFCQMLGYSREEYEAMTADKTFTVVYEDDIPGLNNRLMDLLLHGTPLNYTYRVHRREGGLRWITSRGSIIERQGDICYYNVMSIDVTEQQRVVQQLRESEERFRIASEMSGIKIGHYDTRTGVFTHNDKTLFKHGFASVVENAPQAFVDTGIVAAGSAQAFLDFYTSVRRGEPFCSTDVRLLWEDDQFHWCRVEASVIFDDDRQATQAVIVTNDISELREKEAVYKRWKQSLEKKTKKNYSLYRWNLSQDCPYGVIEGSLLPIKTDQLIGKTFNESVVDYAQRFVHPDDREAYIALLDSKLMLESYYKNLRMKTLEYRELVDGGSSRWLCLTVELIEFPNSTELEAYLMYENINVSKQQALHIQNMATTDSMTGLSNKGVTEDLAMDRITEAGSESCALLIIDLDDLKVINDTLGHAEGDRALVGLSRLLRSQFRHTDIVGRVGGDELLVFLSSVSKELLTGIITEFMQKVSRLRVGENNDFAISCSIGISMGEKDDTYETLFKEADKALYHSKRSGKGGFAFYSSDMETATEPCAGGEFLLDA